MLTIDSIRWTFTNTFWKKKQVKLDLPGNLFLHQLAEFNNS